MTVTKYNTITSDHSRSYVRYAAVTIDFSSSETNFSVKNNTDLFNNIKWARELVLRTSKAVGVKFNKTTEDEIDLYAGEGINMSGIPIEDIFLTTNTNPVVRIWIVGWN